MCNCRHRSNSDPLEGADEATRLLVAPQSNSEVCAADSLSRCCTSSPKHIFFHVFMPVLSFHDCLTSWLFLDAPRVSSQAGPQYIGQLWRPHTAAPTGRSRTFARDGTASDTIVFCFSLNCLHLRRLYHVGLPLHSLLPSSSLSTSSCPLPCNRCTLPAHRGLELTVAVPFRLPWRRRGQAIRKSILLMLRS